MNKKILIIILGLVLVSAFLIANLETKKDDVPVGKKIILMQGEFSPIYASILIEKYPQIESISLENSSEGFVNVFGGIGEDIVIISGQTYEITSAEEFILELE